MNAYREGRRAYSDGISLKSCPYKQKDEANRWREGWLDAVEADPLLDKDEKDALKNEPS